MSSPYILSVAMALPCNNIIIGNTTVKSLMKQFGLEEKDCNGEVADAHLEEFTHHHGEDWRSLPAYLKMKNIVVRDIERKPCGEREKRLTFFIEWKSLVGSGATYKKLVHALLKIKCKQDAEAVCKMLQRTKPTTSSPSPISTSLATSKLIWMTPATPCTINL